MIIAPTIKPREVKIVVIAVEKDLIEKLKATPEDFTTEYSKLIEIIVPYNYRIAGCDVYGGEWIDINKVRPEERHMYERMNDDRYKLCLGTPTSFIEFNNVILECVRTADNYLVAYEKYQRGLSKRLELLAYAHGDIGKKQYDEVSHNRDKLGKKPKDLIDVLCDMAIAAPAICVYRSYQKELCCRCMYCSSKSKRSF